MVRKTRFYIQKCYLAFSIIFAFFFTLVVSYPGGSRRCRAASKEVSGGRGKPTAPERLPESSGRGLGDDFLIEAFSCHVSSFSVLLCFWGVSSPGGSMPSFGGRVVRLLGRPSAQQARSPGHSGDASDCYRFFWLQKRRLEMR